MQCRGPRQARLSLLLFLVIVIAGLVKAYLVRPVYPARATFEEVWPPKGHLLDATVLRHRALEVLPRGTSIAEAIGTLGLDADPLGSGFCLPRAGILYRVKEGWRVRPMTQEERWVWRIPMNIYATGTEDLSRISGIGPSLGARIFQYVRKRKSLKSMDDLLEVPGIGPGRLKTLKEELDLQ